MKTQKLNPNKSWEEIWEDFKNKHDNNPLIFGSPNIFRRYLKENYNAPIIKNPNTIKQ